MAHGIVRTLRGPAWELSASRDSSGTADQFEWATDQAAAAYIAGGGTVPTEDVANFLLECAQVMGYETILPSSLE